MSRWKPKPRAPAANADRQSNSIDPAALAEQAEQLLRNGHSAQAESVSRALLARVPDQVTALMILSVICMASGRLAEAEATLRRGVRAHPLVAGFHVALGRLCLDSNRHGEALIFLENCVLLEPDSQDHRVALVALYQTRLFSTFSEASRLALLACLADQTLTHSSLHRAWLSLLRVDPAAAFVLRVFDGAREYESFRAQVTPDFLAAVRDQELLQRGLMRFLAADVAIERGLTFLRRWCLENRHELREWFSLLCELSRYCFLSEYVFDAPEDWSCLRDDQSTAEAVALLAAYTPADGELSDHEMLRLASLSDQACYQDLIRFWLREPREERLIRASIPVLTSITDDISRAVQAQYEENPYPRWTTVGSTTAGGPDAALRGQNKSILFAGCGTGREAVNAALNFPASRIVAIDLSRASLAYGIRKARELGVPNLSFAQADLLALSDHETRYDWIVASGVLHHLEDPEAGLRALLALLRSCGVLRIALYSRLARGAVREARALIRDAGLPATPAGIRAFRRAVLARDGSDAMRAWLTHSYDFYSLSQCRDLVFHVQERDFTLPEIAEILRALGLSVLHVGVRSPVHVSAYRTRFPDDPTATRLENWAVFEALEPALFAGMYDLWLCRESERRHIDPSWLGIATPLD